MIAKKRIGVQTWGSDGDILPLLALAGGLSAAGHDVTVCVSSVDGKTYSTIADNLGFRIFHSPPPDPEKIKTAVIRLFRTSDPAKQLDILFKEIHARSLDGMIGFSKEMRARSDALIGHHLVYTLQAEAEKAGMFYAPVFLCHGVIPSAYQPPAGLPNLGRFINSLLWRAARASVSRYYDPMVNEYRRAIGLAPGGHFLNDSWRGAETALLGVSPSFVSRPPDWEDNIRMCGFFNLPEKADAWTMPDDMRKFMERGEPPIYMTMGSMLQFDVESSTRLMVEAATLAGRRAVIQSDWDQARGVPKNENIHRVTRLPHVKVFPLCSLVVHHGGSGTTQSALMSGVPSVVVQHVFDQVVWGAQLKRAGAGGITLNRKSVTAKRLAMEINAVLGSPRLKAGAKDIGRKMAEENGVLTAVNLLSDIWRKS